MIKKNFAYSSATFVSSSTAGRAGAAPEELLRVPAALPPPHPRLLQEAPRGPGEERRPPWPGAAGPGYPVTGASGLEFFNFNIDTVHNIWMEMVPNIASSLLKLPTSAFTL